MGLHCFVLTVLYGSGLRIMATPEFEMQFQRGETLTLQVEMVATTPVAESELVVRPVKTKRPALQPTPSRPIARRKLPRLNRSDRLPPSRSPERLSVANREEIQALERETKPAVTAEPLRVQRQKQATEAAVFQPVESVQLVVGVQEVDELPRPLPNNPPTPYPAEVPPTTRGMVVLHLIIDEEGQVESVEVARSSGIPAFDRVAVQTHRRWRFRPAQQEGRPAVVKVAKTVIFEPG